MVKFDFIKELYENLHKELKGDEIEIEKNQNEEEEEFE